MDCVSTACKKKDEYFDNEVKNNFGDHLKDALFGYPNNWRKSLDSSLALLILNDHL